MGPWNYFGQMTAALWILAGCALVTVLKQFGFWRWLEGKIVDWAGRVR